MPRSVAIARLLVLLLGLVAVGGGVAAQGVSSLDARTAVVFGFPRPFLLHRSAPAAHPRPLLIAFHGRGITAQEFANWVRLDVECDREDFLLVYPQGYPLDFSQPQLGGSWNSGDCCEPATLVAIDDIEYTRRLVDAVAAEHAVDRERIYVTGFSNGAMMAYRLAAEAPDLVAAIAPVSGALQVPPSTVRSAVPLISFHGDLDPIVPLGGGFVSSVPNAPLRSQRDSHAAFEAVNGARLPTGVPTEIVNFTARRWAASGTRGAPIERWTIAGHGHGWPSRVPPAGGPATITSFAIDANDLMMDFFLSQRLEPSVQRIGLPAPNPQLRIDLPVMNRLLAVSVFGGVPGSTWTLWAGTPAPTPNRTISTPFGPIYIDPTNAFFGAVFAGPPIDANGTRTVGWVFPDVPALRGAVTNVQATLEGPTLRLTNALRLRFGY